MANQEWHRSSRFRIVAALSSAAAVIAGLLFINSGSDTEPTAPADTGAAEPTV